MQRQVLIDGMEVGVIDFDTLECLDCNEPALSELVDQAADEGFPVDVDPDAGSIHYETLSEDSIGQFTKFLADRGYELGDEVELDPDREEPEYEDTPQNPEAQATAPLAVKDRMLSMSTVAGFPIVIEHKAGEERYGKRLPADYGYIRRTGSAEGNDVQMDCFIRGEGDIFVIDSFVPETGAFDEHKIMIGYLSEQAALTDFEEYYSGGVGEHSNFWSLRAPDRRIGYAHKVSSGALAAWLDAGVLDQPYYAPTNVEYTPQAMVESERCAACDFFSNGVCSNPNVYTDPKIPQQHGVKLVAPSGWCKEFKVKETDGVSGQ